MPSEPGLPAGHSIFARYAFPPNELGYCGPADSTALLQGGDPAQLAALAKEFDGTWPYLQAIADAAGITDPLDPEIVQSYWVGGQLLEQVDPADLLARLRTAFKGQVTGMLSDLTDGRRALAHHSFHVFVVYPWIRFLDRDPTTPLRVMQQCRIRWGTVESIDGEHAEIVSRGLTFEDGLLALGDPGTERVRWCKDGISLAPEPAPGDVVAAHWDWVCGALSDADTAALNRATQMTLDLVNSA